MKQTLIFAALVFATTSATLGDPVDLGYGPVNVSSRDVRAVCKDTSIALVGPRFKNTPDTSQNRRENGIRIQTASGLLLSSYGGIPGDEQASYLPALQVGQRVQVCLTTSNLARRGGLSNRFCVNSEFRFYNYNLERVFTFDDNGCHA